MNLYSSEPEAYEPCSIEASRKLVQKYDLVITSGGIGPTHDGWFILFVFLFIYRLAPSRHHVSVSGKSLRSETRASPGDY